MKIAMFHPTDRDRVFTKHSEHEFIFQTCDDSCDIIYAASISRLPQALEAKKRFNKPLVCWCWDIPYNWREWEMTQQGVNENTHRDGVNNTRAQQLRQCDFVITASKWVQNSIKEQYNIDSVQMYQYIDVEELDSINTNQIKTNSVCQISRFFYNKKFHNTVIAGKDLDYEFNFFGTGIVSGYGNEIKAEINKHGTNVIIHEKPNRIEMIMKLKQSKLLVSPSVFEGWGITPVEALYCGIPVLLSDLPVFKEVYGDNVIYHERNNPEDMGKKLEIILGDEELQKKIVKDCQPIINEFTPEKFAIRWDEAIKNNI